MSIGGKEKKPSSISSSKNQTSHCFGSKLVGYRYEVFIRDAARCYMDGTFDRNWRLRALDRDVLAEQSTWPARYEP